METISAYAPLVGLIFFFVVFLGIAWRTYHPRRKRSMRDHAEIPFKETRDE